MGQHLWKQGKRKCCVCKNIYPLNRKYFYNNKSGACGFSSECIPCHRTLDEKTNPHRKIRCELITKAGFKCKKCKIYNDNFSFFDIDHIKIKKGRFKGKHRYRSQLIGVSVSELQVLCPNCHRLKTIGDRDKKRYAY